MCKSKQCIITAPKVEPTLISQTDTHVIFDQLCVFVRKSGGVKRAGLLRAPHYGRNHRILFKNYDTFCTNKGYFYLANETNQHLLNSLMVQFNQISLSPLLKNHRFDWFRWQKRPPIFGQNHVKNPLCCVFEVGDSDALRWKARRPENSSNGSSCFYLYC